MKQIYFKKENIEQKSSIMINNIAKGRQINNFSLNSSALLVIDMQKYFLDEQSHAFIPSASAIINNILELINLFNKHNRPVIFTKHINNKDNAGMMNRRWREILTQDNPYSELINELIHQKATIIEKTQYDSFYNTQLENILAQCSIKELVITGVMTQLCCETTLRSAFVRGYYPIFPIDSTATYNEELHLSTFRNLLSGFIEPVTTKGIINCLEKQIEKQ